MGRPGRLLLLFLAPAVFAKEELLTPGEQLLRGLERALAEKDHERCVALLGEIGDLYRWPASAEEAEALLEMAGRAARADEPRVVVAALRALGRTGAKDAGAMVERFLRKSRPAPGEKPIMLAAVRAAGDLRAFLAVPALLRLAQSGPDMTVADEAFFALGGFCEADADVRERVTDQVLRVCQLVSKRRARWTRLRAPGLRALQRLTGRKLNTVGQFTDWWRYAKTKADPFSG